MAELNFGLLNPPGSQSIGNAFVQGMDQAAAARAQENQNAMSQYALSKAKREDQLTNQMLAGMQGATTIEQQADVLRRGGRYKEANELLTSGLERDIKRETLAAQPGLRARTAAQTDAAIAARARSRQEFEGQALRDLGVNPSDDNIRALGQDAVIKGIYTQEEADQKVGQFLAIPLANRAAQFKQYGAPAAAPEATPQDIRTMQALGYPPTPAGYISFRDAQRQERLLTPEEEAQKTRIALASRPPAQPRPEQPAQPVVDPDTGRQILVSREEAIRRRMTPASAMEGLAPKEIQKREAALPAATSAVTGFDTKAKSFIKDLIALRDDVGLDQITGPIYGRTGSVSREGSRAQALYDKIVAKGGFQALQDLRDASKTGGALGNVSNQEGKQLTASFAAIDRRQNAADVRAAINQAIADIEGARTRTREAYDSTYSYKSAAGQEAPAGAGKPSLADIFGGKKP
jgi:hypothetical protein